MPLFKVRVRLLVDPEAYNWVSVRAVDATDARRVVERDHGGYWTAAEVHPERCACFGSRTDGLVPNETGRCFTCGKAVGQ